MSMRQSDLRLSCCWTASRHAPVFRKSIFLQSPGGAIPHRDQNIAMALGLTLLRRM